MILSIQNSEDFIGKFLRPVSKINNSCILNVTGSGITTLLAAADNTVILYAHYNKKTGIDGSTTLNLPDLSRLIKVLECIENDHIELKVHSNHLEYRSDDIRFKYHLLEEGILTSPAISIDKIKQVEYDAAFVLPYSSLINLIKSSMFAVNINKVYILTEGDNVYAEIDDKQAHNVDSIRLKMCVGHTGTPITDPLPISFETIRTLAGCRCDKINVLVNTKLNVMTFEVNNNDIKTTYMISGLAK
jgi:DNA polymerase III sliding clamp (beta) subunit (PCNA family)